MQVLSKLLPLVFLVSTMLDVGMRLTVSEIFASLGDRRWLLRALLINLVILPLIAVGVSRWLELDTLLTAALLLLATAPGGPGVIKFAAVARGDSALTVAMVVTLLLLSVFSQPLLLPLFLDGVGVNVGAILQTLLMTVFAPLLFGLMFRARRPSLAARLRIWMEKTSSISLALFVIVLLVLHWDELQALTQGNVIPAVTLFIFFVSAAGWLSGGPHAGPRLIQTLCCGQSNMAAAFVIANQNFDDPRIILILVVALITSIAMLLPLCLFHARRTLVAHV